MNAQSLGLPQATSCPVCGKRMEQMRVELVFMEETGELEAVVVSCPHCGMRHDFSVETMARAVALDAVKQLQAGR